MVSMAHAKCGLAMCSARHSAIPAFWHSGILAWQFYAHQRGISQHSKCPGWRTHKLINFWCGFQRVITAPRSPLAIVWAAIFCCPRQLRSIKRMVRTHYQEDRADPEGIKDNRAIRNEFSWQHVAVTWFLCKQGPEVVRHRVKKLVRN